ncbi:MAG TPA: ParB/RepB/Spo0J family partition protein [Gammaproteobacteria bacterium]|nr:ParB/RepB/Spo0J family partition protein [Gammaproteobacteria bacterium]
MAIKRHGLGRGLDALLGIGMAGALTGSNQTCEIKMLPIDLIQRSRFQPRFDIRPETLETLADSIRGQGIIQPILVRPLADLGRYEIIAGERRWRAAQMAGLHQVPAIVQEVPDRTALSLALIENIQREDLNPLEEAEALARLVNEFELTHQEVAEAVGRSRATVTNLLRLLDLGEDVKRLVKAGDLEMGHARALLALEGLSQSKAAQQIVAQGLSVREAERLVQRLLNSTKARTLSERDPNTIRLEEQLSLRLGASVAVRHDSKGKGALVIRYNSLDELDGILAHIR